MDNLSEIDLVELQRQKKRKRIRYIILACACLIPLLSYLEKKVVHFGHHLKETVLYPVPHRQYVFSIPKILRKFFLYDRILLDKLSQCASKSLKMFLQLTLGKKIGISSLAFIIRKIGTGIIYPSARLRHPCKKKMASGLDVTVRSSNPANWIDVLPA